MRIQICKYEEEVTGQISACCSMLVLMGAAFKNDLR